MRFKNTLFHPPIIIFILVAGLPLLSMFAPSLIPSSRISAEPGISVDQYIHRLTNGSTDWQRYNAAAALGELRAKKAIPSLIAALDDKNESVRMNSIKALEELGAVEAKARIELLLNDSSPDVQANAKFALEGLAASRSPSALDTAILVLPALLIVTALLIKQKIQLIRGNQPKFKKISIFSWIIGVILAFFALQPYAITETDKAVGFPFKAAIFQSSVTGWTDYIGPFTLPLLVLYLAYAAYVPQVLVCAFLLWHYRRNKLDF